jgi:hypothetical protein
MGTLLHVSGLWLQLSVVLRHHQQRQRDSDVSTRAPLARMAVKASCPGCRGK